MIDAMQAALAAQTVFSGSPEYAMACELCRMRGYPPDDQVRSVTGLPPMTNWQWIIAEQIIEQQLRIALAKGSSIIQMPS